MEVVCKMQKFVVGRVRRARANLPVLDENNRIVGRVVSVFGPVEQPYVKIQMQRKWGRRLYLGGEKKWKKTKKRKKRRNG